MEMRRVGAEGFSVVADAGAVGSGPEDLSSEGRT